MLIVSLGWGGTGKKEGDCSEQDEGSQAGMY
jgi:hypothetical protein